LSGYVTVTLSEYTWTTHVLPALLHRRAVAMTRRAAGEDAALLEEQCIREAETIIETEVMRHREQQTIADAIF
jgi:hypothetical protein